MATALEQSMIDTVARQGFGAISIGYVSPGDGSDAFFTVDLQRWEDGRPVATAGSIKLTIAEALADATAKLAEANLAEEALPQVAA